MSIAIPPSLQDVADTLGTGVVLQLMQLYGGQDVLFGKQPKPDMVAVFGPELAEQVNQFLTGQKIYVPNGKAATLLAKVKELQSQDMQQKQIAKALNISDRHVRRLSNAPQSPLPLFPDLDDPS